jgi:hypothetical protein
MKTRLCLATEAVTDFIGDLQAILDENRDLRLRVELCERALKMLVMDSPDGKLFVNTAHGARAAEDDGRLDYWLTGQGAYFCITYGDKPCE